jgi:hypothetical protein
MAFLTRGLNGNAMPSHGLGMTSKPLKPCG